ncbi:MAG: DUF58 domain-containing protein [Longimicrobiales bacterium]
MAAPTARPLDANRLLAPEVLAGLSGLDVVAKTIVRGFVAGLHRSPFLGSGEDFDRHRAYQQGDDVRRLDWRLYGRTDRLHVRLFQEDSNLQAYILIDATESMGFQGSNGVSKLRYAQFVGAALSHLMLKSGDAVGLASVSAKVSLHVPPRNRGGHLNDVLLAMERLRPAGSGSVAEALDEVGAALRKKGRVVVLSDCLEGESGAELAGAVGRLRARGDEVQVLRVATAVELGEVDAGPARYFDPENPGQTTAGDPSRDPCFREKVAAYYRRLGRRLEEQGAEFVPLRTDMPVVTALRRWLTERINRARQPG